MNFNRLSLSTPQGRLLNETIAEEAARAAVAGARPLKMNHYKVEIAKALVKRLF
jgi:hypothetical protein